jgi:hypothetical protein
LRGIELTTDLVDQAKKIESLHFVSSILGFVGVISPGLLILFIFKRDLFISLDLLKLILLSISLTLPFILCNLFCVWILWDEVNKGREGNRLTIDLVLALYISTVIFYLPLAVAFLWRLSLHTYIWSLVVLEITFAIVSVFIWIVDAVKKKN